MSASAIVIWGLFACYNADNCGLEKGPVFDSLPACRAYAEKTMGRTWQGDRMPLDNGFWMLCLSKRVEVWH